MYKRTTSESRLNSFKLTKTDTQDVLYRRYIDNIKLSEALYPSLSLLEVTLRNSIDYAIETLIKPNWLFEEISKQNILKPNDYTKLLEANNTIIKNYGKANGTKGKLISELNFVFWIFLCSAKYNPILWTKKNFFMTVFPNYPKNKKQSIADISSKLQKIRKLRNRIFHYEPIYKQYPTLINRYDEILEILSYLPQDSMRVIEQTCRFKDIYNQVIEKENQTSKNPKHCTQ